MLTPLEKLKARLRSGTKSNEHNLEVAIYTVATKIGSLKETLEMPLPRFFEMIELINFEHKEQMKAMHKAKRR